MKLILIISLICLPLVSQSTTKESNGVSNWLIGTAIGEGRSRFELNFAENKKLRPSTLRIDVTRKALYQWQPFSSIRIDLNLRTSLYDLKDPFNNTNITAISLMPLWNFHWEYNQNTQPFIAIGIGGAYLDSKVWMDRKLGSHFNFEDTLELGLELHSHKVSVGISHFSNADTSPPNHGANITYFSYAYNF